MLRVGAVAVFALLILASSASAIDETYAVSGRANDAPYEGSVTLSPVDGEADALQVTHAMGSMTLTGRGHREGLFVRAEVQQSGGLSDIVSDLDGVIQPGQALQLTFQKNDVGTRWRVRVEGPQGLIAAADGGGAPLPPATSAAREWIEFRGVPFVKGAADDVEIHFNDPRQGQLGDCYFVAGMIALARARPDAVRSMIADRGDGEYEVTLRGVGRYLLLFEADVRVAVDSRYPAGFTGKPVYAKLADEEEVDGQVRYELWPMMLERAYAQHRGGYAAMESGWPGVVFGLAGAKVTTYEAADLTDEELRDVLDRALAEGKPVSVGFAQKDLGPTGLATNVIGHHAYAVTGSRDGGYILHNPWGSSHPPRPITPAELRAMGPKVEVGDL